MTPQRPWRAIGMALMGLAAALVGVAGCNNDNNNPTAGITPPDPPVDLVYQLNPGEQIGAGDSIIEPGILLSWFPPSPDSTIQAFVVYGDPDAYPDTTDFEQVGITTSISFHDAGVPFLQYDVTSEDIYGDQSAASNVVVVNAADTVQSPSNLVYTAYDSAALLGWSNISATGYNASHFDYYRIYSDSVSGGACVANDYALEGTSVSNAFAITGLANGVPRCYFVTAVTKTGHESNGSNIQVITPESTDPPFSAASVPPNTKIVWHHPIKLNQVMLNRGHGAVQLLPRK
jgi:hypothetical protein